jgi:iron complex outermembrane receptor protein
MFLGRVEPGGAVNLVLKRPLDTSYTSVEQDLDSWGMSRTTLDTTGAIDPAKIWLYRVNLAYSDVDSFRDFVESENLFIAPTLSFRPNADFRLNVDLEYQNTDFVADSDTNIPAIGNRPAGIPIDRYLQEPAVTVVNPSNQERKLAGFDWTYQFAPGWSMTNRFSYEQVDYDQRITGLEELNEVTGDATRWLWDSPIDRRAVSTNFDINGTIHTGSLKHTVLLGTDFRDNDQESAGVWAFGNAGGSINIFNPVYSFSGYVKPEDNEFFVVQEQWYGVYGQDMISMFDDRLHFLVGGRYDWAETGQGYSATSLAISRGAYDPATGEGFRSGNDEAFSPRAGVILQPQPWLSVYGSYSQSFGSTNAIVEPGAPTFDPEEAEQWEGGVKTELLDKRLTATMAYFDITKTNIVQTIAGTPFSRPVGEAESKGLEFDIAGRLDEHWSILANYAYANAVITQDEEGNTGNRLMNVPRHAGGVWLKYDFTEAWRGLSIGGGIIAMGDRPGDNENSFVLPGFVRVDALLQYEVPKELLNWGKVTTLKLNINNVFDEVYYTNASDRLSIFPGDPRTFLFSLRSEF